MPFSSYTFVVWSVSTVLALLPAMLWLFFWYRKTHASPNVQKLIFRCFFFGAVGIIPLLGVKYMMEQSPNLIFVWDFIRSRSFFFSLVLLTFILAGLEEFLKSFSVIPIQKKDGKKLEPQQLVNGIMYFISAGVGFAFMENALYFRDTLIVVGMHSVFWKVFVFRSFATMFGHALFSGVFGLLWMHAIFSERKSSPERRSIFHWWHAFFDKIEERDIFHRRKSRDSKQRRSRFYLMFEAFFVATLLHAVFNLLLSSQSLGINLMFFIPPFLIFTFLLMSRQFGNDKKHKA